MHTLRLIIVTTCSIALYWSTYCVHGEVESLSPFQDAEWPNHGGGLANRREAMDEHRISPRTATTFQQKWIVETGADVSASPAIADGVVYFPTWGGEVYAVSVEEGSVLWRKNLTQEYFQNQTSLLLCRHTPVVHKEYMLVGLYGPALLLALDRRTGDLFWSKLLDSFPYALLSMSGSVYESFYYVGVSSLEEGNLDGPCCAFQGSFVKVEIETGSIIWQTKMLPDNGGKYGFYAGAALWGSSPPIDKKRRQVYLATGNLYQAPPEVEACQEEQLNKTTPDVPNPCIRPEDHSESVLALDLDTGEIAWGNHLGGYDTWVLACTVSPPRSNCPSIPGPDYDFGEAPMLVTVQSTPANKSGNRGIKVEPGWRDVVVAGQKSGIVWALDRHDGKLVWDTVAGPGGTLGGASWGSATDSERVYTNIINNSGANFTLNPSNTVINAGGWVAMNASSGDILWSVAAPNADYPIGPVTVANGVLVVTSKGSPNGTVHALDAKNGSILWTSTAEGSITGGVSVSGGCIYLPVGVTPITTAVFPPPLSNPGHSVRAFCVD